jgi:membrane protein
VGIVARVDRYQRGHRWLGLPIGVIYKLFDDRGLYLAALVTYYGFVSLFPLLLVFTSSLGFFLHDNPDLQQQLVQSALRYFPIIGPELRHNVTGFHGSGLALVVGVIGTLYGALGAMQAAQAGFNQIYGIPRNEQPNPVRSRLRSVGLVALLGAGVLLTTGLATLVGTANSLAAQLGLGLRVLGYVLAFALNVGLFTAAFQLLTACALHARQVIRGALLAGAFWEVLQTEGTRYAAERLKHTSAVYGTFGLVLTAIAWIYLEALVLMLSAEVNVVIAERLWPRALLTPFTDAVRLTDADRRAYSMYAKAQRFKGFQRLTVEFDESPATQPAPGPDAQTDHVAGPA